MNRSTRLLRPVALLLSLAAAFLGVVAIPGSATGEGLAGSAGTDTALPVTDSAVTVHGRPCASSPETGCGFQNMTITVNQTRNLLNQAVSVTWSGAAPTSFAATNVVGNYLQIFQCWGDDDGTHPDNPGPPPEKCEYGGFQSNQRGFTSLHLPSQFVDSRVVSTDGWSTYDSADPQDGVLDEAQGLIWKPFVAVDGPITGRQANFTASDPYLEGQGGYWLNTSFNAYTTNEDVVAVTHPDGTGSELVTVDTGLEAPGLGCGQKMEPVADGTKRLPKCWLVIVPRGTGAEENPPERQASDLGVMTSPLAAASWRNRIAIPLEFKPVDTPCPIGADERRIAGSELATPAITSWQPHLCAQPGSPPYNFSALSDDLARQQVASGAPGAPGMVVLSRPIPPSRVEADNPIVYAPLTLSGVTVGFNIERVPAIGTDGQPRDPAEEALAGIRAAHVNLTPRLVAKLLTESYQYQFGGFFPPYDWLKMNPADMLEDPDFVQYNPEFQNLKAGSLGAGRIVVEQPTGDAASAVWSWILADPEAAGWLAGNPDPWGMKVNPQYNTDSSLNPSGVGFGNPVPNSYPKSEPFCYQSGEKLVNAGFQNPRALCMLDIAPYMNSMEVAAAATRAANEGSKTVLDTDALTPDTAWVSAPPQPPGARATLSITDTASAARFGLQTAALSRAGDDGPAAARSFIAPDTTSLLAGEGAMTPSDEAAVLKADPTAAGGAYPLTMLTYAAVAPRSLQPGDRKDYADFISYASSGGQHPGLDFGELPPGYAPLPAPLQAQATTAAAAVLAGAPATATTQESSSPIAPSPTPESSTVEHGSAAVAAVTKAIESAGRAATLATRPATADSHSSAQPSLATGARTDTPADSRPANPQTAAGAPNGAARPRTPWERAGFGAYAIPLALGVALVAVLAVLVLDDRWLRAAAEAIRRPPTAS